jgi:hypothetical protein
MLLPLTQFLSVAPPVPTLEALFGITRIEQRPPLGSRAKTAVEVADQGVVRSGRALERGSQICLDIPIGSNEDLMATLIVWHGRQRGLNRLECLLPTAAIGVVAEL